MSLKLILSADGSGSCEQAVMDLAKLPGSNIDIVAFMTNVPGCKAMSRPANDNYHKNTPRIEISHKGMKRREHEQMLEERLDQIDFDFLVLLGDMRLKSREFVEKYANRILNTHPAPIPQFRGVGGYEWAVGQHPQSVQRNKWNCATFHYIEAKPDRGILGVQTLMEVLKNDAEDSLASRGLPLEHRQICEFLTYLSQDRVDLSRGGGIADILDHEGISYKYKVPVFGRVISNMPQASNLVIEFNKEKDGQYFFTVFSEARELDRYYIDKNVPENLVFTYAYWDVKELRKQGKEVEFYFNKLNIHPVIMKKDQDAGEKPL